MCTVHYELEVLLMYMRTYIVCSKYVRTYMSVYTLEYILIYVRTYVCMCLHYVCMYVNGVFNVCMYHGLYLVLES